MDLSSSHIFWGTCQGRRCYVFPTEEEALKDLYDMVLGEYELMKRAEELHRQWEAEDARARAEEER